LNNNVQKDIISKEFDTKITKNQLNTRNLVIYSCKHATTRSLKKGSWLWKQSFLFCLNNKCE